MPINVHWTCKDCSVWCNKTLRIKRFFILHELAHCSVFYAVHLGGWWCHLWIMPIQKANLVISRIMPLIVFVLFWSFFFLIVFKLKNLPARSLLFQVMFIWLCTVIHKMTFKKRWSKEINYFNNVTALRKAWNIKTIH